MASRASLHSNDQAVDCLKAVSSDAKHLFQAFAIPFALFSFLILVAATALFDLLPGCLSIAQGIGCRPTGGVELETCSHIFAAVGLRAVEPFKVSHGSLNSCLGTLFLGGRTTTFMLDVLTVVEGHRHRAQLLN